MKRNLIKLEHYLATIAERSENWRRECVRKKPHRGIEPACGSLTLCILVIGALDGGQSNPPVNAAATNADVCCDTALGVFRCFQVTDFDGFLFLVLLILHV